MLYDATPATPTNLVPADNSALNQTTTQVTLSWLDSEAHDPEHAVTYSIRVTDSTDPDVRHAGNNCPANKHYICRDGLNQTSLTINVRPNHAYSWSVTKVVEFKYQIGIREYKTYVSSKKAAATFRTGECDAAQIVNVAVSEIIEAGATVYATVLVRNVGSKTWTPELGYKLGSISPNAMVWGVNRAQLNTASRIMPGQYASFNWPIQAPQYPRKYVFQWRMLLEGQYWFGQKTTIRYLRVDAPPASPPVVAAMWVKRDLGSGSLKRLTGDFIVLRGGNYHVFEKDGKADRRLLKPPNNAIEIPPKEYAGKLPCPGPLDPSTLDTWPGQPWAEFFSTLSSNDINLVRVFLMTGFGIMKPGTANETPKELYPFKLTSNTPRKWQVKKVLTNHPPDQPPNDADWNVAYFDRLRDFAEKARSKGVYLQFALFNYYELDDATWGISIWNPARSDDFTWGKENLVYPQLANPTPPPTNFKCSVGSGPAAEGLRHCFFIEPPPWSGLRNVQEQFVRKVVRTLRGMPNIILEVMNEPHGGSQRNSAKFASTVIDWIIDEGKQPTPTTTTQWRPLISVDAFRQGLDATDPDKSDVDWWADPYSNPIDIVPNVHNHVANYEEIDIISYHGLSGPKAPVLPFKCPNQAAPLYQTFSRVDLNSIRARLEAFRARHPSKALMMSTDSVRVPAYNHKYGDNTIDLSDGRITTDLNHLGKTDYEQMTRSDLNDWAFWCFSLANQGTVIHFQNHSNFEATYKWINDAYRSSL